MAYKGGLIGNDNLYVPDAPTIGTATAGNAEVSVTFTAPSDVGNDDITAYGVSATDGTNVIGATGSSSPITLTGLTNGTSYTAQVWAINDYGNGPLSAATSSFSPIAPRAIFSGGYNATAGTASNIMDYITITSTGNATDFGDLDAARYNHASQNCSSSTRGIASAGGYNASIDTTDNVINYVSINSTGNSQDFGDLLANRHSSAQLSNDTRGIFGGGNEFGGAGVDNVIQYITIASTGNASDFGDVSVAKYSMSSLAGTTRGIFAGGLNSSNSRLNVIEYITIGSTGNVTDFGDLTLVSTQGSACCNNTRGLFGIGASDSGTLNNIDYITIASTGNASDFGDLTVERKYLSGTSGGDRGVFGGGGTTGDVIDYVTITSTGNATDFGDLTEQRGRDSSMSNGHGGLA